jgi:mannose-6-phosphate isomerase-like protein (cupin superfamily)
MLDSGQSMTIPVGKWHSFTAMAPTVCLEVYEAAPVEEDIIRRTTGGNLNRDKNEAGLP